MSPLLEVDGLAVEFASPDGRLRVVEDVSFTVSPGETLGLVGESGSGKTVTALSVLGMVRPPRGRIAAGSVRLDGRELVGLPERALRRVRGAEIGMVFQEPRRSLDPAFTIGAQIVETVRAHRQVSRRAATDRALELLDLVGIPDAPRRLDDYPHELSGGMAQRVMLAIALSCSPRLLIADEPTTALDVTVQARVLDLVRDLQRELGLGVLFVSHDLGVIAEMCDRVAVMYAGRIVEQAPADALFRHPRHPYSAALLASIPDLDAPGRRMSAIAGVIPSPRDRPAGCRFRPRCVHAVARCEEPLPHDGDVDCVRADELTLRGIR
jgi:peptide/nickel transport system ATP-binding protein